MIAYSLGNLVFDSPYVAAYEDTDRGFLVKLAFARKHISKVEVVPYRLTGATLVRTLADGEFAEFADEFRRLAENIVDEQKFRQEWSRAAEFRWQTEYRAVLNGFSENLNDPENKDYARRSRNLFACPTHSEMIEKIFLMLEEGTLQR